MKRRRPATPARTTVAQLTIVGYLVAISASACSGVVQGARTVPPSPQQGSSMAEQFSGSQQGVTSTQPGGPAAQHAPADSALAKALAAARALVLPKPLRLERVFAFAGGFAQQWRLTNGLRIVLAPDSNARVVAYHTWVAAGSADEMAGATGAAHLLEHLMFKATETQPAGAFDRLLEAFGASANATTWLDWTSFHETILPSRVAEVAKLEADRLHRIRFDAGPVASELKVVRNERSETVDDDPDAALEEVLYAAAYGKTPYGHPTIGWDQDLARMSAKTVQTFYTRHYRPDGVWIVLSGAVNPATVLPLLVQEYGVIPAGTPQRSTVTPAQLPKLGGAAKVVRIDAEADRLLIGWRTVAANHADHPALTMLVELLTNSPSARVTDALVHKHRLAAHVVGELPATRRAALLELQVELLPGKGAAAGGAALRAVLDALLNKRPFTPAELASARNRLLVARYASLASADGRADALGMFAAVLGDPAAYTRWWRAVEQVNAADVQRVAKTWLVAKNRVVVHGVAESGRGVEPPR